MAELAKTGKHHVTMHGAVYLTGGVTENVDVSGTADATSVAPNGTTIVRVVPLDEAVYIRISASEDPDINYGELLGSAIPAGVVAYFGINAGERCSFLTTDNTKTGVVNVTFL